MSFDPLTLKLQLTQLGRFPGETDKELLKRRIKNCKSKVINFLCKETQHDYQNNLNAFVNIKLSVKQIPGFADEMIAFLNKRPLFNSWMDVADYLMTRENELYFAHYNFRQTNPGKDDSRFEAHKQCIEYLNECIDTIGDGPDFMFYLHQKTNYLATSAKLMKARDHLFLFVDQLFKTIRTEKGFHPLSDQINAMYSKYLRLVSVLKGDGDYETFCKHFAKDAQQIITSSEPLQRHISRGSRAASAS